MFFAERRKWKTDFTRASEEQEQRVNNLISELKATQSVVKDVDIFMKHVLEIQMISQLVQ